MSVSLMAKMIYSGVLIMVIELYSLTILTSPQRNMQGLKTLFVWQDWLCYTPGPKSFNFSTRTEVL